MSVSASAAVTEVVTGKFLVLLLVTGGFGEVTFFGAVAATAVGGAGLGLATLAGLPTCAFRGTLACGGVIAGDPAGMAVVWAGAVTECTPPCLHLLWVGLNI